MKEYLITGGDIHDLLACAKNPFNLKTTGRKYDEDLDVKVQDMTRYLRSSTPDDFTFIHQELDLVLNTTGCLHYVEDGLKIIAESFSEDVQIFVNKTRSELRRFGFHFSHYKSPISWVRVS